MEKDEIALLIRIKQLVHKPVYYLTVGGGSFLLLTIISYYVHHFFRSHEDMDWMFSAALNFGFSVTLPWTTIEWKSEKKGKIMMAAGLTTIAAFFWFYDFATMVGFHR